MKKFFNRKNGFIFLMMVSTFALAGSAAYYSVFGLSSLFAGARFEVIIMAGALEMSKLIVASYLHNNWKKIGWMKWYLTLAVGVLMVITSAGIYGFLTSAYQKTADQLGIMDKQINVIELKKDRFSESLDGYKIERQQLNTSISELTKGLSNNTIQYKDKETGEIITTTSSSTRRVLNAQLDDMKEQRNLVSIKMEAVTDSITKLDLQILDLESNNEVAAEIGPLRYMAEITGKPMSVIVNWFTLLIVFVFDPLAIAMVIALNKLSKKEDDGIENSIRSIDISDNDEVLPTPNDDSDGKQLSIPKDEVGEERKQTPKEEVEEIPKVSKEVKKEVSKKITRDSSNQTVRFIPTNEEAKKLYGEMPVKKKPKHTYVSTQRSSRK